MSEGRAGEIKKLLFGYYVIRLLGFASVGVIFATYALYLESAGRDFLSINLVNLCFMLGIVFFEVPTGSFADAYGHRASFVAGMVVEGLALILYFFGESHLEFAAAEIVLAFGVTLQSGSLDAWFINHLRRLGWRGGYGKIFTTASAIERLTLMAIVWPGVWAAQKYGLNYPFLIGGLTVFAGAAFSVWAMFFWVGNGHADRSGEKQTWRLFFANIGQGARQIVENRRLLFLTLAIFCLAFSFQPINMQWSILFKDKFATINTGIVAFVQAVGVLGGTLIFGVFTAKIRSLRLQMVIIAFATGATIALLPQVSSKPTFIAVVLLHELPRGLMYPLVPNWTNELISDDRRRATIISYTGMLRTLGAAAGLLGSGVLANIGGIPITWLVFGAAGIVMVLLCLFIDTRQ